jgi:carbon-monoxide dehydrogenase iron sulfur subunit
LEKILIQPEVCDGCLDCEEACAQLHGKSGIMVREVKGSFYPIICQQCEDAPCKLICPTEAITDQGIESEKCIGGLCMMVCPFGAIVIHDRKAHKCNQCPDLDTPACIKACSKRGIAKVDTEKMALEKQEKHIQKLTGIDKKTRKNPEFINVLTANSRAKKALNREE